MLIGSGFKHWEQKARLVESRAVDPVLAIILGGEEFLFTLALVNLAGVYHSVSYYDD